MKQSLKFIYKQQKDLTILSGIGSLLGWDQMTYMPPDGAMERSEQTAYLSTLAHKKIVSNTFWNHIQYLHRNLDTLSLEDKLVVERLKKDVEKARKIPSHFVKKIAKTTTLAYQAWEQARHQNKFSHFAPHLTKIIELEKQYCTYLQLPGPLYNTLLDDYEEGMTTQILQKEFSTLKQNIIKILEHIKSSKQYQQQKPINLSIDQKDQKRFGQLICEKMLLPKNKTRIDVSTHPFTTSMGNNDIRITTNYGRQNPMFSFFSTIHEAGHALYELGMPQNKFKNTVISASPSLGLHESQSRFWENMIARSTAFWTHFSPLIKKAIDSTTTQFDFETMYKTINQVQPSLIRVEADELTYCLHVILRFELEQQLLDNTIEINELPNLWNEKMDEMLGVTPKNDIDGVLQDMHWSAGNIGYFPTYAIGSIYAAQLYKTLKEQKPQLENEIKHGNFNNIVEWFRKNIHQHGRTMTADEIIKQCCGQGLNSQIFIDYLKTKYYSLYEIK